MPEMRDPHREPREGDTWRKVTARRLVLGRRVLRVCVPGSATEAVWDYHVTYSCTVTGDIKTISLKAWTRWTLGAVLVARHEELQSSRQD